MPEHEILMSLAYNGALGRGEVVALVSLPI
jgi:hypothetical protein